MLQAGEEVHYCVWERHPSPVLLSLEIFAACLGAFAAGDRADRAKEEPQNGLKFLGRTGPPPLPPPSR